MGNPEGRKKFLRKRDYDEYVKEKRGRGKEAFAPYILIRPNEPDFCLGSCEGLGEFLAEKIEKSAGLSIETSPENRFVTAVREGRLVIHCHTQLEQDEEEIFLDSLARRLRK